MGSLLVQLFIDPVKWDAADWTATAFFHDPTGQEAPGIGLVFGNIAAGREIFFHWAKRLGAVDKFDELAVSIVEGEIPGYEPGYSLYISSNPANSRKRAKAEGSEWTASKVVIISRTKRMTPTPGSEHLARFKQEYRKHGRYLLVPVSAELEPDCDYAIEKREINFMDASSVTARDPEAAVFPAGYFQ